MSPTEKQQKRERDADRAYALAKRNFVLAVVAVLISGGSASWQVYAARNQKHSYGEQLEAVRTSLRLLTASVAPQLLKAVDDSLVSALTSSPSEAAQALDKVTTETSQLRKLSANLPFSQVSAAATKLDLAVTKYNDLLSTWQATAEVVSYRSEVHLAKRTLPNCLDSQSSGTSNPSVLFFHDCSLDLGAVDRFKPFIETITQKHDDGTVAFGSMKMFLTMKNVDVRYSGGEIIYITGFECSACTFTLDRPLSIPPRNGQILSQTLLTANLDNTRIALPNGQHLSDGRKVSAPPSA